MNNPSKLARQRAIRELIARSPIHNQQELVAGLRERGFDVTHATVSRDVAELRLIKVPRPEGAAYLAPEDMAPPPPPNADDRLRRILADIPVTVGRSGLILVLTSTPGTASVIAQAIDESTLTEPEGTLAGDNTLIVLFADEARLERWLARFRALQELPAPSPSPATTEALAR